MVVEEGSCFVGHFEVPAKVLEKAECLALEH